jgi:drug/metabolite transporter (DMT)-like permease
MYSTLAILGKLAYANGLGTGTTLLLRYAFSFILLSVFIKLMRQSRLLSLSLPVLIQGSFLTGSGLFFFLSLTTLSAGIATVILFTHPVLVALLSVWFFKEKLTLRMLLGLALAMLGISLISGLFGGGQSDLSVQGIIFALMACCCYTGYSLMGQKTCAVYEPLSITATISLLAVLLLIPVFPRDLTLIPYLNGTQIMITLVMAIMSTLLAILFFLKGVQKIGAAKATLISTAEPIFCLILAFFILGEKLTPIEIAGSILVFISMQLAVTHQRSIINNELASDDLTSNELPGGELLSDELPGKVSQNSG